MAKSPQCKIKSAVTWPREAKAHANEATNQFKSHLTSVAEAFAGHERADFVSKKHVDESFAALSRMGLQSKRWWQRSDTWTACGAFMFAISFSMPDVCVAAGNYFSWTDKTVGVMSVILFAVTMTLGACLYFWARHHGSLPKKPGAT